MGFLTTVHPGTVVKSVAGGYNDGSPRNRRKKCRWEEDITMVHPRTVVKSGAGGDTTTVLFRTVVKSSVQIFKVWKFATLSSLSFRTLPSLTNSPCPLCHCTATLLPYPCRAAPHRDLRRARTRAAPRPPRRTATPSAPRPRPRRDPRARPTPAPHRDPVRAATSPARPRTLPRRNRTTPRP